MLCSLTRTLQVAHSQFSIFAQAQDLGGSGLNPVWQGFVGNTWIPRVVGICTGRVQVLLDPRASSKPG